MVPMLKSNPLLLVPLAVALACGGEKATDAAAKSDPVPNPTPPAAAEDPQPTKAAADAAAPASKAHEQLLPWLDPEAVSVGYERLSQAVDPHVTAAVYALPPRAEDLLQAPNDVDHALDAVQPTDAPALDTWIGPEALCTVGRMSQRPLVLRPLIVPIEQARARLEAMGLRRIEDDVFEIWEPQRVFPYRVVVLEPGALAFIHASEPGSGTRPLAMARDMPSSEIEGQLREVIEAPGGPVIALFASGPMMHFDLDADVLAVRFELRSVGGSLDGQTILQVDGEPEASLTALTGRKAAELSDQAQALLAKTAFSVDQGVIAGRLQLTSTEAGLLYEEP